MESNLRLIEAFPGKMEFGLVLVWRPAGGAKCGTITAFVAVIRQVEHLGGLLYADGFKVADLDSAIDLLDLLDVEPHRLDRKLEVGPVWADRHADTA